MAINLLSTNTAAIRAQTYMRHESALASSSIKRLSSGHRIDRVSDDILALSLGTSLRSQVKTLKEVLVNAAQGISMLGVADGGLQQITDMLVRQKELTVQASSGSLSNTERAFLNQEFVSITAEIDRVAANTKFNDIKLLDGSLAKEVNLITNSNKVSNTARVSYAANVITLSGSAPVTGDVIVINGVRAEFVNAASGTEAAKGKVSTFNHVNSSTLVASADNLAAFLNNSTDARLANFSFFSTDGGSTLHAVYTGGAMNGQSQTIKTSSAFATPANVTMASTITFGHATTIEDGLGSTSYDVVGTLRGASTWGYLASNGVYLAATDANTTSPGGLGNQGIQNNEAFIGDILQNIEFSTSPLTSRLNMRLQAGDIVYTANNVTVGTGGNSTITLDGTNIHTGVRDGGSFRFKIRALSFPSATIYTAEQVAEFQKEFRESISGLTVRQNRNIMSFNDADAVVTVNGTQVANLSNMRANFISDDFSSVVLQDIKVTAPSAGASDAVIEMRINGERYRSYEGLGNTIATNSIIALHNMDNPNKAFTFRTGTVALPTGSNIAMDLSTSANAQAVEAALLKAFGMQQGNFSVQFQMGRQATDTLAFEISSMSSARLYDNKSLNILTAENVAIASAQIDRALEKVKKEHADVGGVQSRFNFAAASTERAIVNQDIARGRYLDTDLASESSDFASIQVRLRAGISVLTQSNKMPFDLLKLLG